MPRTTFGQGPPGYGLLTVCDCGGPDGKQVASQLGKLGLMGCNTPLTTKENNINLTEPIKAPGKGTR
jgi:hypothetical protein